MLSNLHNSEYWVLGTNGHLMISYKFILFFGDSDEQFLLNVYCFTKLIKDLYFSKEEK